MPGKKVPTPAEVALAFDRADKVRELAIDKTPAAIGHQLHLPVGAVERVLSGQAAPPVTIPPGATMSPPPASDPVGPPVSPWTLTEPSWMMGGSLSEVSVPQVPSVYDSLDQSMRSIGIQSGPRQYVIRRFGRYPADDYQTLLEILSALSLPTGVAKAVVDDFKELSEGPTVRRSATAQHPETPAERRRREREERRQDRLDELDARREAAEVQILERQAKGEPPAPERPPESEEVRLLRSQLAQYQQADAVRQAVAPLAERIRGLEDTAHQRKTVEQVEIDSFARAEAMKANAQASLANTAVSRVDKLPTVQSLLATPRGQKVLVGADRFIDSVTGANSPEAAFERAGIGEPPSPEDMLKAAQQLDAAAASGDQGAVDRAGVAASPAESRPTRFFPRSEPVGPSSIEQR